MFKFTDTKTLCEQGAWVHLKDNGKPAYLDGEDGKPDKSKPIRVKVRGVDSPTFQEKTRQRSARNITEHGGKVDVRKMSESEIEDFLALRQQNDPETWVDATITWENMPGLDGKVMEFSEDAAREVYHAFPAIVRQLNVEAGQIDDFLALTAT
jgi:hypothetical protein